MAKPSTAIVFTRVFEGTLHQRLYDIWSGWAARHPEVDVIEQLNDTGKGHREMIEEIWDDHAAHYDTLVITEHDFIPDEEMLTELQFVLNRYPALLPQYCTRNPQTMELLRHPYPGAWFMAFRTGDFKERPDFGSDKPHNDPGNNLQESVFNLTGRRPHINRGVDDGMGLHYPRLGTHLFWSRHIQDNPNSYVAGFSVREMQHHWVDRISRKEEECESYSGSPSAP